MDPLAVIYNENQWRVNKVSPLFNLQYKEVKLKQYASSIKQALTSAVATEATSRFLVNIEGLPLLKYSNDDAPSIMITVTSTQEHKKKTAYNAIILSWGKSITLECAIHLPYMLERGEQKVGHIVKTALQNIFDCNIKDYNFTQFQLLQLGFNFLENDSSRSTDPFTLVYKTPQVDFKDKLTMAFEIGDIQGIWTSLKDETSNETDLVTMAYQTLQNQLFHMLTMDVSVLDICEVILPKAEVKFNGIVKMKTPELVNSLFTVLNKITDLCVF
ncbi:unnamed protein product [Leptosia nina]|uniref:Centromere protein L n=1 Tax=Leptosia nina TaxID=320188 RepID=A0AAV1JRI7_9NEOP